MYQLELHMSVRMALHVKKGIAHTMRECYMCFRELYMFYRELHLTVHVRYGIYWEFHMTVGVVLRE